MYLSKNNRSPYYQIVYLFEGKKTTKSTGKKLKAEALKYLSEFERNLLNDKKFLPVKLSQFVTEYKQFVTVKSKAYQKSVNLSFNQFQKFLGKDVLLKNIDVRIIESFIHFTYSRTQSGAGLYHRTLKAAFSKALSWGYIGLNPFKQVKLLKQSKLFPAFINEIELSKILEVTNEKYLKVLFTTAFYTGMRLSETINLRMSAINFNERFITVQNTDTFTTKNRKDRIIPICDTLFDTLIKFRPKVININSPNDEYLFYRIKGVKLAPDFVSKRFKKSVLAAGINNRVHFHSLRHSTASLLAQRGVSLLVIKELLGHSSLKVTEIYSHLQRSDLTNAIQQLGRAI